MGRIDENNFYIKGISYHKTSLDIREKLYFDSLACRDVLRELKKLRCIRECVLLSTCNRTELYYITGNDPGIVSERIESLFMKKADLKKNTESVFYNFRGISAIEHLFKVSSGLDSMILGEPQIFGQVKEAYSLACDEKYTGPAINRLFHHAFRVGKQVRNETGVGEGAVSVSFAAVELAKKVFGKLKNRSVLLIGAGKIGELCAQSLSDLGVKNLYISNRTKEKADEISKILSGQPVLFENIPEYLSKADIVITSVSSGEPILKKETVEIQSKKRKGKALVIIDLGVPRNVDESISGLNDVFLYNIDCLKNLAVDNLDKRKNEAIKADEIISGEVGNFCVWLSERETIPVIKEIHERCENIQLEELEKIKNRLDEESFALVEMTTRRIIRKIIHNPVKAIRSSESGAERDNIVEIIRKMFIDIEHE